jgi:hypothetical protein
MALTLDSTLATAQDGINHRPIVDILSSQAYPDIPFDGQAFDISTDEERYPAILAHSSGRIIAAASRDDGTVGADGDIILIYSNTAQTEWFQADIIGSLSGYVPYGISAVEMANGNILVAVVYYRSGYGHYLKSVVVTPTGTNVQGPTSIYNWSYSITLAGTPRLFKNGSTYTVFYSLKTVSGGTYAFAQRSTTDGYTWGSETSVSIGGLTSTNRISAGSILVATSGKIIFVFEYVDDYGDEDAEISNIYWSESVDSGSTWSSAVAITTFDEPSVVAAYPTIVEQPDEDITVTYVEKANVLTIGNLNPDDYTDISVPGTTEVYFDSTNNKLVCLSSDVSAGNHQMNFVTVVDVPTWSIDKVYDYGSVPSFPSHYNVLSCNRLTRHNEGTRMVSHAGKSSIWVVDWVSDTITNYYFEDDLANSVTQNVDYGDYDFDHVNHAILYTYIEDATDRLWVLYTIWPTFNVRFHVGYIDLTETPDVNGNYTWNNVIEQWKPDGYDSYDWQELNISNDYHSLIFPGDGYLYVVLPGYKAGAGFGHIFKYNTATWTFVEDIYQGATYGDFPRYGLHREIAYYDGVFYSGIQYESLYGEEDRRGIAAFNTQTGATTYLRPSTPTIDDYAVYNVVSTGDGRLIVSSPTAGIYVYDIDGGSWTLYDDETLLGFPYSYGEGPCYIDYDPVTETIFSCMWKYNTDFFGAAAFSINGAYQTGQYMIGTIQGDDTYVLGSASDMTISTRAADFTITIDSGNDVWAMWSESSTAGHKTYWDRESSAIDLSEYLLAGSEVSVSWSVADSARLKFKISNGPLFDPSNLLSILSVALRKGRQITLRFGETVSSTDYWQNQGTFMVAETKMRYLRGEYPSLEIVCDDLFGILKEGIIISSEYYSSVTPESAIADIAEDLADIPVGDITVPTLTTSHEIWHQWIDKTVWEMFEELGDHFNFFPRMTVDNDFTVIEFDFDKTADHTYSDLTAMIEFSPDDTYSNYTNQVTVIGEARGFIEVIYDYEMVERLSGTMGWWGEDKNKIVYFSRDGERECVNPKLNVIQSVREFEIFSIKGGGSESIASVDDYDKYCVVYIEGPNLVGVFIAALAAFVAAAAAAIYCDESFMCGFYVFLTSTMSSIVINILGAVANYDYEIWAQPVGKEKLTIQATANDLPFQQELGRIVNDTIEDPLAYTVGQCAMVAAQEILKLQLQRRRVKFSKVAHLQDEIGDIISLPHPYNGQAIPIYIVELTRTMTIPERDQPNGNFTDKIEGWRIS